MDVFWNSLKGSDVFVVSNCQGKNHLKCLRYQGTANDNTALSPFECQAFHKTLTKYIFSESLITEDYENVFR